MYKNIAYYHGLESSNTGPKVDWMKENFDKVYSPKIDYSKIDFQEEIKKMKALKINYVVGSSIGGYFSYWLAHHIKLNLIVFNPALPYRTSAIEPVPESFRVIKEDIKSNITILLGSEDEVIKPEDTMNWLESYDYSSNVEVIKGIGHRIPTEIFIEKVSKFL